jgi:hypothetical protein
MKEHSTGKARRKVLSKKLRSQIAKMAAEQRLTIGLDLGDRYSRYCILDAAGQLISEGELPTSKTGLNSLFEKMPPGRAAANILGTLVLCLVGVWLGHALAELLKET